MRLISGFVLFFFVLGHYIGHAFGIVSLGAMNEALNYSVEPWRSTIGTIVLISSLLVHAVLAVWAVYERSSLNMKSWEWFQVISGFLIPAMLAAHVLNTRGAYEFFGLEEGYVYQLYAQWVGFPFYGFLIVASLLVVWVHGCIGWHYWLRYKGWYNRYLPIFYSLALIIPVLALAGFLSAGLRVSRLSGNEKWVNRILKNVVEAGPEFLPFIKTNEKNVILVTISIIALLLAVHAFRWFWRRTKTSARIIYSSLEGGGTKEYPISAGATVLEMLQQSGVQHASVCGGRGRCSTCRVKVEALQEELPQPSTEEQKILNRIAAPDNVRLACQIRPTRSLSVTALLRPEVGSREALNDTGNHGGEEQEIAVLFADIRAFTQLTETKLPFDTAFLLNRYFAAMGQAIEECGGHVDKFIGDGVMALFGVNESLPVGCRKAVRAAQKMSERLIQLNTSLANELHEPLRIGIGIHSGTAIVGKMGYKDATSLTAIGDVVNTASRLESMTKELKVELIISEKTARESGLDLSIFELEQVAIRGRNEPLPIRKVLVGDALFKHSEKV
ncbi:MAG: adenylate/guanylate cyclase domain-containing protein [Pseudomonadota bacterium]